MKIWQSYGSGHSARLSVVGRFKTVESAALVERALQDFVNAAWEERYESVAEFIQRWKGDIGGLEFLGPTQCDLMNGLDDSCNVEREGTTVSVTSIRSNQINGIIQIMLLKEAEPITVTGRTGP